MILDLCKAENGCVGVFESVLLPGFVGGGGGGKVSMTVGS